MNFCELIDILKQAQTVEELDSHRKDILDWLPCCAMMVGYDQNHQAHQYDLWNHLLHTVLNLPRELDDDMRYLASLLHDIGKPDCRTEIGANNSNAHYYGHSAKSMEIIRDKVLPSLVQQGIVFTEEEQHHLLYYVRYHDELIRLTDRYLFRHLSLVSLQEFRNLMHLQIADARAHKNLPFIEKRICICMRWLELTANEKAKT